MSSSLSTIPVATRRRGAVGLAGLAVLSTVVGMLAIVDGHAALVTVGVLALLSAAVIALAAWGMWQSVRLDVAGARLDAAVAGVLAEHGADCADGDTDGNGTSCSHTCQTCALAAHRPQ